MQKSVVSTLLVHMYICFSSPSVVFEGIFASQRFCLQVRLQYTVAYVLCSFLGTGKDGDTFVYVDPTRAEHVLD